MNSLLIYLALSLIDPQTDWRVTIELLQPVTSKEFTMKISAKNESKRSFKILKNRRTDYKYEKTRAIGNYVIQIEKLDSSKYILFPPSADINPVFEPEEYISIPSGETLSDTLRVAGLTFTRAAETMKGLPAGRYRVKVYFNPDIDHP